MTREEALKAKEQFLLKDQFTTVGTLLYDTNYKIVLDNRTTKSFMSKQQYLRNKF